MAASSSRPSIAAALGGLLGILLFLPFSSTSGDDALDQRLASMRAQNTGSPEDVAKLASQCLDLLPQYQRPEDEGKIYATAVFIHSDKGVRGSPEERAVLERKIAEYCQKALEFPLEPGTASRVYVSWACALETMAPDSSQASEFSRGRRDITEICLNGLRHILNHQIATRRQPLPSVGLYHFIGPENHPVHEQMRQRHKEQWAARAKVILQNDLIVDREALEAKIVYLHSRPPHVLDEVRQLATDLLKDEKATNQLLEKVKQGIERWRAIPP